MTRDEATGAVGGAPDPPLGDAPPGTHQPLLGALAGRAGLGEAFATEALGLLLQNQRMRNALVRFLEGRLGTDLSPIARVRTEVDHRGFGRTDMEGQDAAGRPLLIIEAKFGASLTVAQVSSYLALQAAECGRDQPGLVLLMPESRAEDAALLLRRARDQSEAARSSAACVSWRELLAVLSAALADDERGPRSLEADLIQLEALVDARTRYVLPPLGVAAAGEEWQTRRSELVGLVDIATQRLADSLGAWRGPQVARRDIPFAPSYYLKAEGPEPETYFSVGLHRGFAAEGLTPTWLRFHKVTGGRLAVRRVREALGDNPTYGSRIRTDGGHLWLPITLDPALEDDSLVDYVVAQIRAMLVAAGAASVRFEA